MQTTGQAIANRALSYVGSTAWGSGTATYCLKFVQDMGNCPWLGATAWDGWQNYQDHTVGAPEAGDFVYFAPTPDNENYGHVAVVVGPDQMVGVANAGVGQYSISWWGAHSAPLLGYQRWWSQM